MYQKNSGLSKLTAGTECEKCVYIYNFFEA
jgi:hypothetical protein